jgi:hypothetical protein
MIIFSRFLQLVNLEKLQNENPKSRLSQLINFGNTDRQAPAKRRPSPISNERQFNLE